MNLFDTVKEFFKTGKIEILPNINVSEDIKNEVSELVEYIYSKGNQPPRNMPSKNLQKNLLAQVYAMSNLDKYESQATSVYENAISKENSYKNLSQEEIAEQMHFAIESLCFNIIQLSKDAENSRKYWEAMDNLSERLLQINHDKFKKLFLLMHEWQFGYVYENDTDYKYMLENIKRRLNSCHGIKQTDFYNMLNASKPDLQFTLYYAEKFKEIKRVPDGRTYRLYLKDDNIEEIPKYEFTRAVTTDGNFDYKKYWKEIERKIKENSGIRQTEFYALFDWDSEVVACALREAEKDSKVKRERDGNSYLLYLPDEK